MRRNPHTISRTERKADNADERLAKDSEIVREYLDPAESMAAYLPIDWHYAEGRKRAQLLVKLTDEWCQFPPGEKSRSGEGDLCS